MKTLSGIAGIFRYNILIGRNPEKAPPGSIIIFPCEPGLLACGLAGIIKVIDAKRETPSAGPGEYPAESLARGFQKINAKPIRKILSGAIAPRDYLDSREALEEMERNVHLQKTAGNFMSVSFDPGKTLDLNDLSDRMRTFLSVEEKLLEENADRFHTNELEIINSRLILLKDIAWGLERDFLANISKIRDLSGGKALSPEGFRKYRQLNSLLNALDRLEVRGRDSAGIQISFTLADSRRLDDIWNALNGKDLFQSFLERTNRKDLVNGSILFSSSLAPGKEIFISFTYKTASAVGELGRNVRRLRDSISSDPVFHVFADEAEGFSLSLAHTRWASVGSITEENCHPVNNFAPDNSSRSGPAIPPAGMCAIPAAILNPATLQVPQSVKDFPFYGQGNWTINVVLNGDIDNYQELRSDLESKSLSRIAPELTTDTKIIPLRIEMHLAAGHDLAEAFRLSLNDFEGSHAIAMQSNLEPGKTYLALRGSGQSIYVGICPDQYIFSSELYGIVEETSRFLKMDGEASPPGSDGDGTGQVFIIDQESAGHLDGIRAFFYDGTELALGEVDIKRAEITTRDIDRGPFPHFFLKEISESALSVKKTMRGKYRITAKKEIIFNLGEDIIPKKLGKSLTKGDIRSIVIIGHGTAAVAGAAIADGLARYLGGTNLRIEAKRASELSGFLLEKDLRHMLVIAVTQSGTTTDTNRAVSMASERGATVIAVVNRRQSDITHKADGVFYTSDGRDIEMAVASTKAFYSQIIAGHILGLCLARTMKSMPDEMIAAELSVMEQIPGLMARVIEKSAEIRESVRKAAKNKRYWAVVGSGPNKAAADEIRIKLSELCYKTISSDFVEDKKHIDLSSEPLIIVCAAGSPEAVIGDIVKDSAIFRAHKAGVVVFADEGETRFDSVADSVISLPRASMPASVILNTVAGHLWGYYAACHIDEDSRFLQEFRNRLNMEMVRHQRNDFSLYERISDRDFHRVVDDFALKFHDLRREGAFSFTSVSTVSDISLLLKYAAGKLPLEDFWLDFRTKGGMTPIDLLNVSVGHAIDELSRPIDAIRHQAKTVTVGTSRKDDIPKGILFDLLGRMKFSARNLISRTVPTLTRIQKAVATVKGFTLYGVNNLDEKGEPAELSTISIRERGGVSVRMKSRVETSGTLTGTKKTIVRTGSVFAGYGKSDGAPVVVIPLLQDKPGVRNLLVAHVEFNDNISLRARKEILGDKYKDIKNMVNEYNLPWEDSYLEQFPVGTLLGESVEFVSSRIKKILEIK
ncbi:MAG: SIS domain-containing protein [Syntrophales bacterium]